MGGSSGGSRDNQMASLINAYMPRASTRGGGGLVAKADGDNPIRALAKVFLPKHDAPTPDEKPTVEEDAVASNDDPKATDATDEQTTAAVEETAPVVKTRKVKTVIVSAPRSPRHRSSLPMPSQRRRGRVDPVNTASVPSGWAIQVASSPKQSEAQAFLDKTSKQAPKAWPMRPASPSPSTRMA